MTINLSFGKSIETFFRLCVLAPFMEMTFFFGMCFGRLMLFRRVSAEATSFFRLWQGLKANDDQATSFLR